MLRGANDIQPVSQIAREVARFEEHLLARSFRGNPGSSKQTLPWAPASSRVHGMTAVHDQTLMTGLRQGHPPVLYTPPIYFFASELRDPVSKDHC